MKIIQFELFASTLVKPRFWIVTLALLGVLPPARAALPEPDNVVYGQIAIANVTVTSLRTNVVVEVWRTNSTGTNLLSSYRMGANPALGNYYTADISLESAGASQNPLASATGDANLLILVKETRRNPTRTNYYYTNSFTVRDRGFVTNINFGIATTGFGAWAAAFNLPNGAGDQDGDGVSNTNEYILGTSPVNAASIFTLAVQQAGAFTNSITRYTNAATRWTNVIVGLTNRVEVSFLANQAQGTGYEGLTRYFAVENATNPGGPWTTVPGYASLTGSNQLVRYVSTITNYFDQGTNYVDLHTNYLVANGVLIPNGTAYLQLDTNYFLVNLTNRSVVVRSNAPPFCYRARVWLGP